MDGLTWLWSLGAASEPPRPEWIDVLIDYQERFPGRGAAARELADEFDVDVRSAQRYLSLNGRPTRTHEHRAKMEELINELHERQMAEHEEERREFVADLLAAMDVLDVGTVLVKPKSSRDQTPYPRRIGRLDGMADGMALVAESWRDGDEEAAADELSDSILARYDNGRQGEPTDRNGLAALLYIVDYQDGIDY